MRWPFADCAQATGQEVEEEEEEGFIGGIQKEYDECCVSLKLTRWQRIQVQCPPLPSDQLFPS